MACQPRPTYDTAGYVTFPRLLLTGRLSAANNKTLNKKNTYYNHLVKESRNLIFCSAEKSFLAQYD